MTCLKCNSDAYLKQPIFVTGRSMAYDKADVSEKVYFCYPCAERYFADYCLPRPLKQIEGEGTSWRYSRGCVEAFLGRALK